MISRKIFQVRLNISFFHIVIGYTDISGAICEKLHQNENNDVCSIQRIKNMTTYLEFRFYISALVAMNMHIRSFGTIVFECAYEKFCNGEFDEEFLTLMRKIFNILILDPIWHFSWLLLINFMINWILFCFVDPLKLQIFTLYLELYAVTFFTACLTFILWSYGFCKTVFHKVKTKIQDFWRFMSFKK